MEGHILIFHISLFMFINTKCLMYLPLKRSICFLRVTPNICTLYIYILPCDPNMQGTINFIYMVHVIHG